MRRNGSGIGYGLKGESEAEMWRRRALQAEAWLTVALVVMGGVAAALVVMASAVERGGL